MWKWCFSGRRQISGEGASQIQKLGVLTMNIQDIQWTETEGPVGLTTARKMVWMLQNLFE